ncbi:helix-turn-helix domain-containing protein [Aggregatibacter actinomycetemcomitans]|uniref:YdaS family helix-turn-helix protein n=1 Tax=Aggregatibacter actinomycetemcomitans TaxID=714 RepID=UPI00197CAA2E|nr:YdaS family helix-turn-helix protein [Aggregatibacter actinomycetemcomitans]MBN6068856.1 helix-turn-helix domain-containing protein [Aggregatibacter actinomycetemcomitans]MBN6087106.1 helix-turn-helix domain-containing protein [Aggregatibacter actinomycetemcomitans]
MNKVICKAIQECGDRETLAKACNVSLMTVSNWLRGSGIGGKYIKPISDATNGKITVDEILQSLSEN